MFKFRNLLSYLNKDRSKNLKQENELLKENIKYGQIISCTGSWTHDIIKNEIYLTDEVYRILGTTPQDFDGELENFHSFIHPDDLQDVKKATVGALSGKEYDIEYRIIAPEGKVKFVQEKTMAILDDESEPI